MTEASPEIARADLERLGLISHGESIRLAPLAGGVSSDIFKVETARGAFVVKRALAKLRVADDWRAPTSRNRHEADWIETAGRILPEAVPRVLARDDKAGLFAMEYFDPAEFPVWKGLLRDGHVDLAFAAEGGRRLATIHAHTAGDAEIAARFDTGAIFHAIRLEPYFEAAARRHPEVADTLLDLSRRTLAVKVALVHGDVSPKNILTGPRGPVFLDAECAWYGDPAFDVAFCLNHLLLKCFWNRAAAARFVLAFDALAAAYLGLVDWECREGFERRIARLLAAMMLARVDGKSPVEYLTAGDREIVRQFSLPRIAAPPASPGEIRRDWSAELGL